MATTLEEIEGKKIVLCLFLPVVLAVSKRDKLRCERVRLVADFTLSYKLTKSGAILH